MIRFSIFVDGSNQFGSLKHLDIEVNNYEAFYKHILKCAVETWRHSLFPATAPLCQLRRVYWYEVGAIDDWDLNNPKTIALLEDLFNKDRLVKASYMASASKKNPSTKDQTVIAQAAWNELLSDMRAWYAGKLTTLEGMKRFHHAVMERSDFIDVRAVAHWKVDFIHRTLSEKGLDTALAVDMVALHHTYDVAIIISGDADNLPGVYYVQEQDKMVGVVEFLKGSPPEERGKATSNRLKLQADFVVPVYETDLIKEGVAVRPSKTAQ